MAGKDGAKTLYIEPGSPWENGYCESSNSKLRDEFLNGEIFCSMKELRVLADAAASTTTPSGHTLRWAIDRRHPGVADNSMGHPELRQWLRYNTSSKGKRSGIPIAFGAIAHLSSIVYETKALELAT